MKRFFSLLIATILCTTLFAASVPATAAETAGTPDLIVTSLTFQGGDGQVKSGTELRFCVTIKNQGTAAVQSDITVDIGFGTEQLFRLTKSGGLAAGASATLTSPTWTATEGDRMITARVSSSDTEKQSWDNNTLQRGLRIGDNRYAPTYDDIKAEVEASGMYDLTFNEDFNDTDSFDKDVTGKEGYKWYVRRHSAFPNLKPTEYRTENGILTMDCAIDTFAIGAATIDRVTGVGYTFTHGYLEFRLRMPYAGEEDESRTAIWSFPRVRYTEAERYNIHVEMDWMEYYGDNYFTVTMHEQTYTNSGTDWYSSSNNNFNGLGDEKWHTMGYLWEEGSLRCYLDGELFYTQTWGEDEIPMPIHTVKSGDIRFDGVFSYADTQDMMLFIFGSSAIPLELDYVRIWQYGGTAPQQPKPTTTTTKTTTTKAPTTTKITATTKQPSTAAASTTLPTTDSTAPVTTITEAPTTTGTVAQPSSTAANTAPKTEKQPTRDTSNTALWIILAVAAAAAIGVTAAVMLRKKGKTE